VLDFWDWWRHDGAAAVSAALAAHDLEAVLRLTTERIDAVDPRLAWEYGAGHVAAQALVVTAGGDPDVRATARRWLLAAPGPSAEWEYQDMRQANPTGFALQFGEQRSRRTTSSSAWPSAVPCSTLPSHHPSFFRHAAEAAAHVGYLLLDNAVGEESVELWLGRVEPVTARPSGAFPLHELPTRIAAVRAEYTGPTAVSSGSCFVATARRSCVRGCVHSWSAGPTSTHSRASPGALPRGSGRPPGRPVDELAALEDHLMARVGTDGEVVAVETCRGIRTVHLYVDGSTPGSRPRAIGSERLVRREGDSHVAAQLGVVGGPGVQRRVSRAPSGRRVRGQCSGAGGGVWS
jgi:hypothetical protein